MFALILIWTLNHRFDTYLPFRMGSECFRIALWTQFSISKLRSESCWWIISWTNYSLPNHRNEISLLKCPPNGFRMLPNGFRMLPNGGRILINYQFELYFSNSKRCSESWWIISWTKQSFPNHRKEISLLKSTSEWVPNGLRIISECDRMWINSKLELYFQILNTFWMLADHLWGTNCIQTLPNLSN